MKFSPVFLICLTSLLHIEDTLTAPVKLPCPALKIPNGRVKYRSKGRVARMKCNNTYVLIGSKVATCIRGTWDKPQPLCIKPDCPTLPNPRNGHWVFTYRGAVTTLICNMGYTMNGSRTIFCVDSQWNDTVPVCQTSDSGPQTACNFETEDLCGWTQDRNHNFDWSRQNLATPSGHIGTGPSFDHTLGEGFDGHYMYIESSSRLENDTARLLSPVYQPELSHKACFIFWYHMYGATTGTLNVNIKLLSDDVRTVFSKTGEQGNRWYGSVIHLPQVEEPFQIVIEGIRGRSYASDIAIDDVKLTSEDDCEIVTIAPTESFIQTTLVTSSPSSADSDTVAQRTARPFPFPTYLPPPPPPPLPPLSPILTVMTSPAPPYQYTPQYYTSPGDITNSMKETLTTDYTTAGKIQIISQVVTFGTPTISTDLVESFTLPETTMTTQMKTTLCTKSTIRRKTVTSFPQSTKVKLTTHTTTSTMKLIPTIPIQHDDTTADEPAPTWTKTSAPLLTSSVVKAPAPSSHGKGIAIISATVALLALLAALFIFIAARRRITLKRRNDMAEDSDVRYLTSDEILDFNLARPLEDDL